MGTNLTLVPDDVVTVRYAGILSRPAMRELAAMRSRYPKSYDRERFFAEARSGNQRVGPINRLSHQGLEVGAERGFHGEHIRKARARRQP